MHFKYRQTRQNIIPCIIHWLFIRLFITFNRGSACSRNHPTTACPASWYATVFFSSGWSTFVFFSKPATTRSIAASKCCKYRICQSIGTREPLHHHERKNSADDYVLTLWTIDWAKSLAAIKAASLHTLATSAPVKPGVRADSLRARSSLSTSVFNPSKCTLKIDALPCHVLYNI